ncbi:MAG TPA: hypothetical protein VGY53_01265 [Isosphaeraceae bacterium]|nr:hypothetical protein [Isosphaeraceae bacterium]
MPRRLLLLLGLMTATTLGGPLVIGEALRGGESPVWPPDRPIEWGVLCGISALVLSLMVLSIATSLALQQAEKRARESQSTPGARPAQSSGPSGPPSP